MKTGKVPQRFMTRLNSLVLVGVFFILAAVVAAPFYTARSSSGTPGKVGKPASLTVSSPAILAPWSSIFKPLLPAPPPSPEGIATFKNDCVTPQTDFNLGDTVCAKASGVPVSLFPWHVLWVDPAGIVRQSDVASPDDTTTYTYQLPATATSNVNGRTVDNRGTWKVNLARSNGAIRQTAQFTVHQPASAAADVFIQKFVRGGDSQVQAGGSIAFLLVVGNSGPDAAAAVHLVDSTPSGATLLSFTQQSGPACLPVGASDCTISGSSLANGDRAEFTAVYTIGGGASPGFVLTDARVTSPTTDPDSSNNNSTAQFEIVAGSGTPGCVLTCPTGLSFDADSNGVHVMHSADFPTISTTGTCGAVSTTASPNPAGDYVFAIGQSVITVTTELGGQTCTFTVTVNDNTNPHIGSCPADITTFEDAIGSGVAVVNYPTPTATDNSGSVTVTCDPASGSSFTIAGSPHLVTCTATDPSGNTDSCPFNVTVIPAKDCVLTPPADVTASTGPGATQCGTNVTYTNPTEAGTECGGTVSCDHPSGSFFPVGTTLVTCRDTSGASTHFNVTVNDTTAPVPNLATLPTNTGDCSASAGVATVIQTPTGPRTVFEAPTATDNCGQISGTTSDPVTYQTQGTFTVHWVYDDGHGNTTTQEQTIVVTPDTSPPVPDVATLPTVTGECSATVSTVPTATDACTGTVSGTTTDPLTYTTQGDFTITWSYNDGNGHISTQTQTVRVHDVTPPTIGPAPPDVDRSTGAGSTMCAVVVTDAELGTVPTANDNCSVTVARSGVPAGNRFPVGNTNVVYTATDAGGNMRSVTQHVTVHDTTPPTFTSVPANVVAYTGPGATSCGTVVSDATLGTASAQDNCSVSIARTGVPAGNAFPKGDTTVTYTATDGSGNTAIATQLVTVVDNTPPVIGCNADIVADFDPTVNGAVVTFTAPVGTDNCPGATTARTAGPASGSTFPLGNTTVTYTVTDAVGLSSSCSFKVTVAVTSIIGLDSVTISGSGLIDSYDSTIGYPASKGALAKVLSNGTIAISGSGKVSGNVRSTRLGINMTGSSRVDGNATAGTTVSTSGSATIGGTRTNNALAPVMTLPSVPACSPFSSNSGISGTYTYNASTGDLTLSGVNVATLANGNYCFHNISLTNSGQLKVNGPVVIKLTGTLNTSGATSLPNTTLIPSNLQILSSYTGSNGVVFGNSSSLQLVVYAPQTNVNITGSVPLFGTVAAKSITLGNSGAIHYDTRLKTIWPGLWTLIFGP